MLMNVTLMDEAAASLQRIRPYPWAHFEGFLDSRIFRRLCEDFPAQDYFQKSEGIDRVYGQKPHNRYYLAYEGSSKKNSPKSLKSAKGRLPVSVLAKSWQEFINELEMSAAYRNGIQKMLDSADYQVRYAWHMGPSGSEVSPHCDSPNKLGTHIFYFNTEEDWKPEWGGEFLVLDGKKTERMNPDFSDFEDCREVPIIGNQSFIFRNIPEAWHGVKPLRCPTGFYRKLFNVIFLKA